MVERDHHGRNVKFDKQERAGKTGRGGLKRMANTVITKNPEILGGTPVFAGTRVPFDALLDYIEGGKTLDEFLDDFPTVTRNAAIAALEQAKALVATQL
jgi:uncharacterized protein (DUF433 family)